ncbi:uracil-DNA glycosylase [Candidatus Electronema sp. JC]|uniref:uracil-DNA glycosylase n=1 Tax=Candidatus Electronema sp. JC TaxID=3401570 RepID=UPI003AA9450A
MPDPAALLQLLRQTRSLLAAHAAFGLSSYPAAPELRRFAAGRTAVPARLPQQRTAPAEKKTEPVQPQAAVLALSEIARQLADCRRCPAAAKPAPGLGAEKPKLMVISDCFVGRECGQGQLWSQEEDALFWRMMAAIGLNRENVYLTSAIKCPQRQPPPHGSGCPEERACLPWLEAELRAVQPRLICAFGEAAARMLLGSGTTPLLRLRKKLHPCPQLDTAQVLATYPPRLLLQQPELKRAAWEDLQLLQKRLPLPS